MAKNNAMRYSLFALCLLVLCCVGNDLNAQLWKRVKDHLKQTVDNRVVDKSGDITDKAMDKAEDAAGKKAGKSSNEPKTQEEGDATSPAAAEPADYKNYDFVPGDKIIFQPDLSLESEEELPARFTINRGDAEIQSDEGEKILHLDKGSHVTVSPLMDVDTYLPEQFTVELDMMYENESGPFHFNAFGVELRKPGEDNFSATPPHNLSIISNTRCEWGDVNASSHELPPALVKSMMTNGVWHHIALYVRKNIGKAYIDQYRVAASNTVPLGFGFIDIRTDGTYGIKIRNVRIAGGGDDKYNKIVTDGKFITHGILFDVNRSVIKPESMGTLNEVAKLMKEHSDLRFEIDGHTDSDGDADANTRLSQERADAVKVKLVGLGIDGGRLTTKGFGETKPIEKNDTVEGKANNRRVEFVKI